MEAWRRPPAGGNGKETADFLTKWRLGAARPREAMVMKLPIFLPNGVLAPPARRAQESAGEPRRAQESPGEPRRAQESPGEPRRAQESPGPPREPRRAQGSPGEPRRAQESPGEPRRAQEYFI